MYVFPRAGNPTMDITVGLLMTLGHDAENIYINIQMSWSIDKLDSHCDTMWHIGVGSKWKVPGGYTYKKLLTKKKIGFWYVYVYLCNVKGSPSPGSDVYVTYIILILSVYSQCPIIFKKLWADLFLRFWLMDRFNCKTGYS